MDPSARSPRLCSLSLARGLHRLNSVIAWGANALVILFAVVMLLALTLQVIARYAFGVALGWSEELSMALFTWTALLLLALGVRRLSHVRMVLLIERLPLHLRRHHERLIHAVAMLFGAYFMWSGWRYVEQSAGMKSAALRFPIELLYLAAPVSGALIVLFSLEALLSGAVPGDEAPEGVEPACGSDDGV